MRTFFDCRVSCSLWVMIAAIVWVHGPCAAAAAAAAAEAPTRPLICGALWWLKPEVATWSDERLERAVRAQREVGFDLLWLLNAHAFSATAGQPDLLERLYNLADSQAMQVIIDLPQGGWYTRTPAADVIAAVTQAAQELHRRYGHHASFRGWYLNYEINPIRPDDTVQTAYWREVWRAIADECHRLSPGSLVTISPFFLLDDTSRRGFVYLTPEQYAGWWGATLRETGIDVIMLQDSGEHLAFFTLEQREPFWAATAQAAREAGAQFWLNIESGEADVQSWDEYLTLSAQRKVPWRFTPIEWLERKLRRAAVYSDRIINWGYFPFMDPDHAENESMTFGGSPQAVPAPRAAYEAYRAYYQRVQHESAASQ